MVGGGGGSSGVSGGGSEGTEGCRRARGIKGGSFCDELSEVILENGSRLPKTYWFRDFVFALTAIT